MNQLETAFSMFSRDPENIEQLFRRGRLRLNPEPMHVLYLYYMGKVSFYDIANSVYYSDSERLIGDCSPPLRTMLPTSSAVAHINVSYTSLHWL